MDENSCENETSESMDGQKAKKNENVPRLDAAGVRVGFGGTASSHQVSDRCGSSIDAPGSGPSTNFNFLRSKSDGSMEREMARQKIAEITSETRETTEEPTAPPEECEEPPKEVDGTPTDISAGLPPYEESLEEGQEVQPLVRVAPEVSEQQRKLGVGPPPSYSFVMKQKKKMKKVPSPDPVVINRLPPPTYSGSRGIYISPEERTCTLPSFAEPMWRSHSQPALCPRCGIIVLTTTHAHDSVATHIAALALCLFGCWPCCLLPYCLNVCRNTYHHCPICQTFLGLYRPW